MTKDEIKFATEDLEKNLEVAIQSMHGTFVLNTTISSILRQIDAIQDECNKTGHEYEIGQCIYCHAEEPHEWR